MSHTCTVTKLRMIEQLVFFILYTFSPENIKEWKNNFSINLIQDSVLCRSFETPSCHAISVSLSVQVSDQSWKERVFTSIASDHIKSNQITSQPSVNSAIHLISFHFIPPWCHALSVSLSVQVSDQSWKERVFTSIASNRITSNQITSHPSVNSVIHLISSHFIRPDNTPVLWQQQRSTAVLDGCCGSLLVVLVLVLTFEVWLIDGVT